VQSDAVSIIDFLNELMRLKALPRTGWLLRGVRAVESIADHLYGVAFIAMLLADRAQAQGYVVNVEKVLRMALMHDVTEARTGDLPATIKPYFAAEALQAADERIASELFEPLGESGARYLALWHEYETRASLEARLVKAADKLDLLLQAYEYERGGAQALNEFWDNADFASLGLDEVIGPVVQALQQKRRRE
jgi:putative hydrolases of HD superfamily